MRQEIKTRANELLELESQVRDTQRKMRQLKGELLDRLLSDMGAQGAVISGAITLNMRRVYQLYRM